MVCDEPMHGFYVRHVEGDEYSKEGLTANHYFHYRCLKRYVQLKVENHNKCPVCNVEFLEGENSLEHLLWVMNNTQKAPPPRTKTQLN